MDTSGKVSVISALTVSSVGLKKTKEDLPSDFYWVVGTNPILIYDVINAIVDISRPVHYLNLITLTSRG